MGIGVAQDRFLRRARRRWIGLRAVEFAGLCAGVAAGVAGAVVPLLAWRGRDALGAALVLLAGGALAGLVIGFTRRPTILQTAMEADRQLDLDDLLSTAIQAGAWRDSQFAKVVLVQAEAQCRRLSPNQLVLRRLGGRAWGGIGIVWALLLTLTLLTSQPVVTIARTGASEQLADPLESGFDAIGAAEPISPHQAPASRREAGDEPAAGRASEESPAEASSSPAGGSPSSASHRSMRRGDGAGATPGRTDDGQMSPLRRGDGHGSGETREDSMAAIAGGGAAAPTAHLGAPAAGTVSEPSGDPTRHRARDWGTPERPSRDAAQPGSGPGGLESVPDTYRDLVREYFNRRPG